MEGRKMKMEWAEGEVELRCSPARVSVNLMKLKGPIRANPYWANVARLL